MMHRLAMISLLFLSSIGIANISFFNQGIDYWNGPRKMENETMKKASTSNKNAFDWKKYLNPENDEFFKEGNHIPPAPFMEIARRPSKENIKNYLEYMNKKNELSQRLTLALQAYQKQYNSNLPVESQNYLKSKENHFSKLQTNILKDVSISTYFLTTCPACHQMMNTLDQLQQLGVYVELIQIDPENLINHGIKLPNRMATAQEISSLKKSGLAVPFSILRVKEKATSFSGNKSVQEIYSIISLQLH